MRGNPSTEDEPGYRRLLPCSSSQQEVYAFLLDLRQRTLTADRKRGGLMPVTAAELETALARLRNVNPLPLGWGLQCRADEYWMAQPAVHNAPDWGAATCFTL